MQEWFVCVVCVDTIKSLNIGQSNILDDEDKDSWYILSYKEIMSHSIITTIRF